MIAPVEGCKPKDRLYSWGTTCDVWRVRLGHAVEWVRSSEWAGLGPMLWGFGLAGPGPGGSYRVSGQLVRVWSCGRVGPAYFGPVCDRLGQVRMGGRVGLAGFGAVGAWPGWVLSFDWLAGLG